MPTPVWVKNPAMPLRYHRDGTVALASPAKGTRDFTVEGRQRTYVLEESITTDFALVHAAVGDRHGNLVFTKAARNFNPLAAMAAHTTVAEVEMLLDPGQLDPDEIDLPGVYVHRVLPLTPEQAADKKIERHTTRPRPTKEA